MRVNAIALATLLLAAICGAARADRGPGDSPAGGGIRPEGNTHVRMESQRVEILIQPALGADDQDTGFALVTASFNLRNLGENTEQMWVKFALDDPGTAASGDELTGYQAWVNGETVPLRYGTEAAVLDGDGTPLDTRWAYFQATFPPGGPVSIQVSYFLPAARVEDDQRAYRYVFATGQGWQGTIGRAEIAVLFPWEIPASAVLSTSGAGQFTGEQFVWDREDFEPGESDDFSIVLTSSLDAPGAYDVPLVPLASWDDLLAAQTAVEDAPGGWAGWLEYGDACHDLATRLASGSVSPVVRAYLSQLCIAAYDRSADLYPGQRAPYIGIAGMLLLEDDWEKQAETLASIRIAYEHALTLPISADPYLAGVEEQRLRTIYSALTANDRSGTPLAPPGVSRTPTPSPAGAAIAAPSATPPLYEAVPTGAGIPPATAQVPAGNAPRPAFHVEGWMVALALAVLVVVTFFVERAKPPK